MITPRSTLHDSGMVVEDNTATRKALVESLELLNYRALDILEKQTSEDFGDLSRAVSEGFRSLGVALVLSDVVMPGMGGAALFHALRQRGLAVKVLLITGHPLEKELEELRAQGISDWLPKPPSLEQLAQAVARALEEG